MDVSGGESKVQCCEEQYCTGTWNVRSINQGKLEVVKQEMATVNIDILGISELNGLKWVNLTRMAIIAATVGRNPLEKWRGHHSRQKSPKCSTRVQSQK